MTFTLSTPIRFRVSSSTVTFFTKDGEVLDNEVFKAKWANLEEGCTLTHILSCDTPDLHLWKFQSPVQEDGSVIAFGLALRNEAHKILTKASEA